MLRWCMYKTICIHLSWCTWPFIGAYGERWADVIFIVTVADRRWLDYMEQCRICIKLRMLPSMGDIRPVLCKSWTDLGLYEDFWPLLTSLFFCPVTLNTPFARGADVNNMWNIASIAWRRASGGPNVVISGPASDPAPYLAYRRVVMNGGNGRFWSWANQDTENVARIATTT